MFHKYDQHDQLNLLVTLAKRVLALTDDPKERYQIIDGMREVQRARYRADAREVTEAVHTVERRKEWADELRAELYGDDEKYRRHYPFPPYDPKPEQS